MLHFIFLMSRKNLLMWDFNFQNCHINPIVCYILIFSSISKLFLRYWDAARCFFMIFYLTLQLEFILNKENMYNNDYNYSPQRFNILPPVCKNLLIINFILFLLTFVLKSRGIDLNSAFGLHYFGASKFRIWQLLTYSCFHGSFSHLFFNMFAIWMFGYTVENLWGSKRFLLYCVITALGAALMQELTYFLMNKDLILGNYTSVNLNDIAIISKDTYLNRLNTIGASGICFGVLLAFGMMFPNDYIYLYFLVPIKCKWFVIGYCTIELFNGVFATSDGVAHFAHLGGALAGLFLVLLWKKKSRI